MVECDIHANINQVYHSFWQTFSPIHFWLYVLWVGRTPLTFDIRNANLNRVAEMNIACHVYPDWIVSATFAFQPLESRLDLVLPLLKNEAHTVTNVHVRFP